MNKNTKSLREDAAELANDLTGKNVASYASSTAFFFFVGLIPLLMILSALLPLTGLSDTDLAEIITMFTPDMADSLVSYIISEAYRSSSEMLSFSLLVIVYTSAMGMLALIRGMNRIYDIDEKRNYVVLVGVSLFYTMLLITIILLSLVIMVFGETLKTFIATHFSISLEIPDEVYSIRYLFVITVAVILFMAIYAFLPGTRQRFSRQWPGAIFSAAGWTVFSFVFSRLMGIDSIYNTYYGGLAAIVILLLWLYGCFYILLLGAYINHRISKIKRLSTHAIHAAGFKSPAT